jgi:hypothetical protein
MNWLHHSEHSERYIALLSTRTHQNLPHTLQITMSRMGRAHYDLFLAICKEQFPSGPIHWMIMMVHPGAQRCIWLHCVGSPGGRELLIEPNKRFDSWSIERTFFLSRIPASAGRMVEQQARAIPPQSCQYWAVYLVLRLERRGMVPHGSYGHWRHHITHRREDMGPGCLCDH